MSVLGDRFRNGFQPRPPTTPDLDGGRFLADLYKKDSIQANFLQRIINAVNRLAKNAGVGATGEIAPPPPIAAVNVKVSGELAHVTLTHNAPVRRGIQYFLEVDTSPSFPQPIVKHLGSSRSPEPFALPTFDDNGAKHSYYMRAYAQYPGSKPSGTTAFGGSTVPSAITMGGQTRLSLLPSTGSGTGSPKGQQGGSGLGRYPESSKPNPFSAGVVVKQTSPLIAPAPPAVPVTFDQVKLPVGPMQVSQDNLPDGTNRVALLASATVNNKISGQHISNQSVGIVLPLTIFSGAISGANALWLLAGLAPMNIPVGVNSITFNIKFSQSGAGVQTVDQVGISIAASLPSSPAVSATASITGVNLTINSPISGNPNNCLLWIFFKMKGGSNSTFTLTASTGTVNTISPIELT